MSAPRHNLSQSCVGSAPAGLDSLFQGNAVDITGCADEGREHPHCNGYHRQEPNRNSEELLLEACESKDHDRVDEPCDGKDGRIDSLRFGTSSSCTGAR